jgi:hypothetical protein
VDLLIRSGQADDAPTGLHQAIAEFNARQLDHPRLAQQQQQVQPKAKE